MEKKSWLWKRKSSDRSSGETESSESLSSHSERYSDEQEGAKESPSHTQSPEVTSKLAVSNEEINGSVKILTDKLSAALVNVGAKEDLVKQHAKVAEEAVAGWEKAENEVAVLKQQLEAAVQQNLALDVRVNHLDGALKECVRQLRQAREEQEQRTLEAVTQKTCEWESLKVELESQLLDLQMKAYATKSEPPSPVDQSFFLRLESLDRENSVLKFELLTQSGELEIRTIERDLSTQAAETASKQQLESIKKVAKLEAECRRLQMMARRSYSINDQKAVSTSSLYVDSLTDSQSDSGERLNVLEIDTRKISKGGHNEIEPSCSDSWASALIAELDQFKNGKAMPTNPASCSVEIDIMDDFLEMERLAALPDTQRKTDYSELENAEYSLRAELEAMCRRVAELEDKLEKLEAEKAKLEKALYMSQDSLDASTSQLATTDSRMEDLQKELTVVNESKELLEFQLVDMEVEARTMSTNVETMKAEVEKEQSFSAEMTVKCQALEKELMKETAEVEKVTAKCQELEKELMKETAEVEKVTVKCQELEREQMKETVEVEKERGVSAEMTVKCQELEKELMKKTEEVDLQHSASSNDESKVKQNDLGVVAADRLADCQKTISSLARQLESLATLEDFLIDTANLPGFSKGGSAIPRAGAELWKLHSNETFMSKSDPGPSRQPEENSSPWINGEVKESPSSSASSTSSTVSLNHVGSSKSKKSFGKLFSRSRSGILVENHQG